MASARLLGLIGALSDAWFPLHVWRSAVKITAVGHASFLIETAAGTILTDPVYFDPFESGASHSYPERAVDLSGLPKIDCLVISHRHFDHFDVRTLSCLDRNAVVFHPEGEPLIEHALAELGFDRVRPLKPWAKARSGALEIIATPSAVSWPELGLVVHDGVSTLWSLIDTVIDEEIIRTLRDHVGRIDCLLAQYSPILQYELRDGLGAKTLDASAYEWLFETVRLAEPRMVVPSAGGVRFDRATWQNSYGFPVSPTRFLTDLDAAVPGIDSTLLEPGDVLERDGQSWQTLRQAAPFVTVLPSFDDYQQWRHDPAAGMPPFTDRNPLGSDPNAAYQYAVRYILDQLVLDLQHEANGDALSLWREWHLKWRLDLYPPHGLDAAAAPASWWLDFGQHDLHLRQGSGPEADMRTVVTATGIHDLLTGLCPPYSYLSMDCTRHTARTFQVTPGGVRVPEKPLPEPLLAALTETRDLDGVFVAAELRKWGPGDN